MRRVWAMVMAAMCVVWAGPVCAAEPAPVTVGSKKFTEAVVLAEIGARLLEAEGFEAPHERQLGGTRILWSALRGAEIDAYPEYTGTIAAELLGGQVEPTDLEGMRRALASRGVQMSQPLGFDNTYALGMRRAQAERLGVESISDLTAHPELELAFSNEFIEREDGWPAIRAAYRLPQEGGRGLDHDLAYRAIATGEVDVIDLYATDAEIEQYDLRVLEDDRGVFPPYQAVWLWRADLGERAPGAPGALRRLEGQIDAARMVQMNAAAKIQKEPPGRIAARFVREELGVEASAGDSARERGRLARIGQRTLEHLLLVGVSLLVAIAVAVPLGVAAHRRRRAGRVILGAVGVAQTMPSLALLVLMIPAFGIGDLPALVALSLYALLPIVRNTHAGLQDIPDELIESARALGLSPWARLRRVELPLAGRSILAGIKTAAVIDVGTATLGALIGAGGYGQPILTGIRLDDMQMVVLEGALPAALMALAVQGVFDGVERWWVR